MEVKKKTNNNNTEEGTTSHHGTSGRALSITFSRTQHNPSPTVPQAQKILLCLLILMILLMLSFIYFVESPSREGAYQRNKGLTYVKAYLRV